MTRPHSVKLGYQKGPFQAPFGLKKKTGIFHHCKSKVLNLGKASFSEVYIGLWGVSVSVVGLAQGGSATKVVNPSSFCTVSCNTGQSQLNCNGKVVEMIAFIVHCPCLKCNLTPQKQAPTLLT